MLMMIYSGSLSATWLSYLACHHTTNEHCKGDNYVYRQNSYGTNDAQAYVYSDDMPNNESDDSDINKNTHRHNSR